jgi:hypothetical protein
MCLSSICRRRVVARSASRFAARPIIRESERTSSFIPVSKQVNICRSERAANKAAISSKPYPHRNLSHPSPLVTATCHASRPQMQSRTLQHIPTHTSEASAAHTNPYIRGHCDEICDHLLMLAEAYKPPTIKPGDLESEFPGYARAAQEASEIFEAWSDQLDDVCDTLAEFEEGEQVLPCRSSCSH